MKVLCFSPNDAVWRWTLPQAQFLEALQQRGDEIIYVHCDRTIQSFCMSMSSSGVTYDDPEERKRAICERCGALSSLVRDSFGFAGHALHEFVTPEEVVEAQRRSTGDSIEDLLACEVGGVPVGRIALYEAVIQTKHIDKKIEGPVARLYRATMRNAILVAYATVRMLERFKPDICVSYHTAYAYNRTFLQLCEKAGLPVFTLNASFNVAELDSHLVAAQSDPEAIFKRMMQAWDRFHDVVCSPGQLRAAANHLIALMSGAGFAYSVAMRRGAGLPPHLTPPPGHRLALVLLSSYDELLASDLAAFGWSTHNDVFSSQLDWVHWIFDYARGRPDVHFVIRVHPREFPIKGKGVRSEHANLLEKAFESRPANVAINLPDDSVPLYEILLEADAALVAWSSAGMEAGMLGLPVVTYFGDALLYPRALTLEGRNREQYRAMVDEAIASGWSFERARAFFRWAVLMLTRSRIAVSSDPLSGIDAPLVAQGKRAFRFLRRKVTGWTDEQWSTRMRLRRLPERDRIYQLIDQRLQAFYDIPGHGAPESLERETQALQQQLLRIAATFERLCGRRASKLVRLAHAARQAGAQPAQHAEAVEHGSHTR